MNEKTYNRIKNAIIDYARNNNMYISTTAKNIIFITLIEKFYQEYNNSKDKDTNRILDKILMDEVIKTYVDKVLEDEKANREAVRKELRRKGWFDVAKNIFLNIASEFYCRIFNCLFVFCFPAFFK